MLTSFLGQQLVVLCLIFNALLPRHMKADGSSNHLPSIFLEKH